MRRQGPAQKPITKVTQIFQRADGSEARITAQMDRGPGFEEYHHHYVHRRSSPDATWELCSDRPHPNWKTMSVDEYISHGRSEMLQAVTHAEILKVGSLLGQGLDELVAEGRVVEGPSFS